MSTILQDVFYDFQLMAHYIIHGYFNQSPIEKHAAGTLQLCGVWTWQLNNAEVYLCTCLLPLNLFNKTSMMNKRNRPSGLYSLEYDMHKTFPITLKYTMVNNVRGILGAARERKFNLS